jgi:TPP-dependent pyruvate/acetoin dehydrogenase alpha subunit
MPTSRSERLHELYLQMCRIRAAEQALGDLWRRGLVSGEMHLGIGEEAVAAGVVAHLEDGDALALDYRSTPPLVARGVDLTSLFLEMLGSEDGLCGGRAGHMHLMSRPHLAAASGIVGAPGPLATGFGLAARNAGRGRVVVAFFGDGAVNEGMLMESLNLASAWTLPVVFVCKDNRWAVTTRSAALTGGGLRRRLSGFGMPVMRVDGTDVAKVDGVARRAVARARSGGGPTVLLARCARLEGHFLGDPLVRLTTALRDLTDEVRPLLGQVRAQPGAPLLDRIAALLAISRRAATAAVDRSRGRDPLPKAARWLPVDVVASLEQRARDEIDQAVQAAVRAVGVDA